jgi:hypothetical protein
LHDVPRKQELRTKEQMNKRTNEQDNINRTQNSGQLTADSLSYSITGFSLFPVLYSLFPPTDVLLKADCVHGTTHATIEAYFPLPA